MMKTDYNKYFLDISTLPGETSEISASGNGFGLDAGVMARVSDVLKVGAEIRNLWAADYTITGEEKEFAYDVVNDEWDLQDTIDYEKKIHPESSLRVGASLNVPVINTLIAADIDNFAGEGEQIFHLGMEKNLLWNGISLRAGTYNQGDDTIYTAGMGLNLAAFHLDMALGADSKFENSVGGMISFKTKF